MVRNEDATNRETRKTNGCFCIDYTKLYKSNGHLILTDSISKTSTWLNDNAPWRWCHDIPIDLHKKKQTS